MHPLSWGGGGGGRHKRNKVLFCYSTITDIPSGEAYQTILFSLHPVLSKSMMPEDPPPPPLLMSQFNHVTLQNRPTLCLSLSIWAILGSIASRGSERSVEGLDLLDNHFMTEEVDQIRMK